MSGIPWIDEMRGYTWHVLVICVLHVGLRRIAVFADRLEQFCRQNASRCPYRGLLVTGQRSTLPLLLRRSTATPARLSPPDGMAVGRPRLSACNAQRPC
jgi:hypothetical protein